MLNKKKIYAKIDAFAYRADLKRRAERANHHAERLVQAPLSQEEKIQIKEKWGKWGGKYSSFAFYKAFCGRFDACYVPDDYYDYAEHVLNLRWSAYFLQHKCHLKYILPPENRAQVIVQKVDGHFITEENVEMTEYQAIELLKQNPVFVAKIARGTGSGKGVQRIDLNTIDDKDAFLHKLVSPEDMEFEQIIRQSDFMSRFNASSVNTIRFVTLNINGNCTVLSAFLRMGADGTFVDNFCSKRGILVGIDQEGHVNPFGINHEYEKQYKSPTGLILDGIQIPNYDSIKEQIISFHQRMPFANLIGWDVAIDINEKPVVIEINLDSALIELHQVFNGPIFGDRLEEVIQYIKRKEPLLKHQMMIY